MLAALLLVAVYLIGALPFGYLIGRCRGIDLFKEGSGNIGATNAGRVLGRKVGVLVFVLDFLKGALPVAVIVPLARMLRADAIPPDWLRVGAAGLALLGHLFPIYLGFRGGKGVATGAGTIFVLAPAPAALAVLAWIVVLLATRIVSLASLAAVTILVTAWLLTAPAPLESDLPITAYLLLGTLVVVAKHRANIRRIVAGTENRIGDFPMRDTLVRILHVLALGMWFGGAAFFNSVAAPLIFQSFEHVVYTNPTDRTANETIIPADASPDRMKNLASALAGSAVGAVFPSYFTMQAVCGLVGFFTAMTWWNSGGRLHRARVIVIGVALLTIAAAWPLSHSVGDLRVQRFDPDKAKAEAAKAAFATWHLMSLFLSFVTTGLAAVALAMAAKLPEAER
jgi:glycerol-3-phosphate acyltransferase PlsY